ncbi:flagellar biosynthesis protein FlgA [Corynebacterium sp. TAE3-ERU12]|uniref:SAF domain-containing protein n=1 Tax=Corynebacterium sp. TAE3-ERU12 TaxID=2849491 RepID=UPI001C47163E|nr:SAF domain-containing protein [Corynebacterium sp. TAE3-ERU12]MBV7295598.1 flagellar biosynthesis protein FlgA [Corynebacterium sp. TAE3-ERU12]
MRSARARLTRRRVIAAALVVAAAAIAVVDLLRPAEPMATVLVAARDIDSGQRLADGDITHREIPAEQVPAAALSDAASAVARTSAGPIGSGEILTEMRFAGGPLAEAMTGVRGADVVAVAPRDLGLVPLLRTGDVVTVLGEGPEPITRGAQVVLVHDEAAVLLALPPEDAARVASSPTVTLVLSS